MCWHKVIVRDIRRVKQGYGSLPKEMDRGYLCSMDD